MDEPHVTALQRGAGGRRSADHLLQQALREAEADARDVRSRLSAVLAVLSEAVAVLDADGRVVLTNAALLDMVGETPDTVTGRHFTDWVAPGRRAEAGEEFARMRTTALHRERRAFVRADGEAVWAFVTSLPVPASDGSLHGVVVVLSGLSEMQRLRADLRHAETHDPLTGLATRELLVEGLSRRAGVPASLALLRVRGLAALRSVAGVGATDDVLVQVARCLRERLPHADVHRLDGAEMAVVPHEGLGPAGPASDDALLDLARRVRGAASVDVPVEGGHVSARVDVGVARGPAEQPEALLQSAGTALQVAMARAGAAGQVAVHDPRQGDAARSARRRAADVVRLLHGPGRGDPDGSGSGGGSLHLLFQPMVPLRAGRRRAVRDLEAVVRWQHPDRGVQSPDDFLPVVAEEGLEVRLTERVLALACEQLGRWRGTALDGLRVHVNLWAEDLSGTDLADRVARALSAGAALPRQLGVELTETSVVRDVAVAAEQLARLRRSGISTAIDDFGTGYASLTYLRSLPVDAVKVDRSFVAAVLAEPADAAIVEHVVSLAAALRLSVVAEGVETAAQAARLAEIGCDLGQGHWFSPPVPAADVPGVVLGR